jgi:hypothetical protein
MLQRKYQEHEQNMIEVKAGSTARPCAPAESTCGFVVYVHLVLALVVYDLAQRQ